MFYLESVYRFSCWKGDECVAWTNLASDVRDFGGNRRQAAERFVADCVGWYGTNIRFYTGDQSEAIIPQGQTPYQIEDFYTVVRPLTKPVMVIDYSTLPPTVTTVRRKTGD